MMFIVYYRGGTKSNNCLLQVESGSKQGKWLLYLTDAIEISPPGVGKCFINPRNINFLGLRHRQKKSELVSRTSESVSNENSSSQNYQNLYKYQSQEPKYNSIQGKAQRYGKYMFYQIKYSVQT